MNKEKTLQEQVLELSQIIDMQLSINEYSMEINSGLQSQVDALKVMVDYLKSEVDELKGDVSGNSISKDVVIN
jgi:hypothetical protein